MSFRYIHFCGIHIRVEHFLGASFFISCSLVSMDQSQKGSSSFLGQLKRVFSVSSHAQGEGGSRRSSHDGAPVIAKKESAYSWPPVVTPRDCVQDQKMIELMTAINRLLVIKNLLISQRNTIQKRISEFEKLLSSASNADHDPSANQFDRAALVQQLDSDRQREAQLVEREKRLDNEIGVLRKQSFFREDQKLNHAVESVGIQETLLLVIQATREQGFSFLESCVHELQEDVSRRRQCVEQFKQNDEIKDHAGLVEQERVLFIVQKQFELLQNLLRVLRGCDEQTVAARLVVEQYTCEESIELLKIEEERCRKEVERYQRRGIQKTNSDPSTASSHSARP